MSVKTTNERIIFGLKIKQLRQKAGMSFADLAKQTGMSVSYLNEIEKGKKFPKPDKIAALAGALGIADQDLINNQLGANLAAVEELLQSNFLNELPLDMFGIELNKVVEIIAGAPIRVGAFISTLLELSRNYAVKQDNFYFGALRSFLELNYNYFEDIEEAVNDFVSRYELGTARPLSADQLAALLHNELGYTIVENGLDEHPELQDLRSVYLPRDKQLLLNRELNEIQRSFQFGKELAFHHMKMAERANTSSLLKGKKFEEVLNHAKATYFSVALHIPLLPFLEDIRQFFALSRWDGEAFLRVMRKYAVTPEMLFHRLTNVLPRYFDLSKLFFLRFTHDPVQEVFNVDKELHLHRRHHPHGNGLFEHYCRRWVSLSLLNDLADMQKEGKYVSTIVRAQRSKYLGTDDEYLCITLARPAYPKPNQNVSVTLGLLITEELRQNIQFLDDPAIQIREVNTTCERCSLADCEERAAPPLVIERREKYRKVQQKLRALGGDG